MKNTAAMCKVVRTLSEKQKNTSGVGDSIDNMAAGAAEAARTAGEIAKKVGSAAKNTAKAAKAGADAAAASSQAASAAASTATSSASSAASTAGSTTAAGSAGGPVGAIIGLAAGLVIEFKDEIYKLMMVAGFCAVFIAILLTALPNVLYERISDAASEAWEQTISHPYIIPIAYSNTADTIEQSVNAGYATTLSGLASAISREGLSITASSLSEIINGDGTYESGDTYLYVSDPTRMIGLDYDASYIMAAYSASMLNVPNTSEIEGIFNGTAEADMQNKLAAVEDEMFGYTVSKSTETVIIPTEYYTYSSAGTLTYVTGTELVENDDGTMTEIKKLGQKEFFVRNTAMSSTDTQITIDDYMLVAIEIPVPTLTGTVYVTRYYYEKYGERTITPTTKTLTYINCTISNFNEDCILNAFDVNEYELFGHTSKQNWEVIESLKYNINQALGIEGSVVMKVYSSVVNGELLSKNGVPWYRTDVNATALPEIEEPLETYLDDIPVFTGAESESEKLLDFFPMLEEGTLARTVKQGLMILYYPDGSAEKLYSSEYYTSQVSSFISPLPYDDAYCSSDYGYRLIQGEYKMHGGVDLCCWSGTLNKSVIATAPGTVVYSGFNGYGNCIMIDHGNGIVSLYGHLNSRKVSEGDTVSQGQLIGLAGSTYGPGGYSTGPHLHFEIRVNDVRENPRTYVELPAYSEW